MGISFLATRRGLPTPPARGLTSMLEPEGSALRSCSAMVAPYTYRALPVSRVAKASVTGLWAQAPSGGQPTVRVTATSTVVIAILRVDLTNQPPVESASPHRKHPRFGAHPIVGRRTAAGRTISSADVSRAPVYAT